ncbi:hypothetical protein HDE_12880 [Halotydeus destructor]|nr:hypothetical protein HDE_12880 [Halotydeus destructor]
MSSLKYQRWSNGEPRCKLVTTCAAQVTVDNKWISVDYSDGRKAIAVCQTNAMLELKTFLSSRIDEEVTRLQDEFGEDLYSVDFSRLNRTLYTYLNGQIVNTDLRVDEANAIVLNKSMSDSISKTISSFSEEARRVHRLLVKVKMMLNITETKFKQELETKFSVMNGSIGESRTNMAAMRDGIAKDMIQLKAELNDTGSEVANSLMRSDNRINQLLTNTERRIQDNVTAFQESSADRANQIYHNLSFTLNELSQHLIATDGALNVSAEQLKRKIEHVQTAGETNISYLHVFLTVLVFMMLQLASIWTYRKWKKLESKSLALAILQDADL